MLRFLKAENKQKGFTLLELLVVIAIIGLISTIVLVTTGGTREKAYVTRGQQNQANAKIYCAANPGVSTLNGQTVYCDEKYVMWSITLASGATFAWGPETALPAYAKGNCSNLTAEDMVSYPACNACHTLNYAGFSEGWRLPSQGVVVSGYCNTACGRDGTYCATQRQLWDFGKENCNWNPTQCASVQTSCTPAWDTSAVAYSYWSSTEDSATDAWYVYFVNGGADAKSFGG